MKSKICCPNCGSKEVKMPTGPSKRSGSRFILNTRKAQLPPLQYCTCKKCGNEFVAPDDLRQDIGESNKLYIRQVIANILMTLMLVVISILQTIIGAGGFSGTISAGDIGEDLIVALVFFVITMGISTVTWLVYNSKRKKEIKQIEANMQKFLK